MRLILDTFSSGYRLDPPAQILVATIDVIAGSRFGNESCSTSPPTGDDVEGERERQVLAAGELRRQDWTT
jgi:hypothetical protein